MERHESNLSKLCRICTDKAKKRKHRAKTLKRCIDYQNKIKEKYSIDISLDENHRHPQYLCHLCYSNLYLPKTHALQNDWPAHTEGETCLVCMKVENDKGGRPAEAKAKYDRLNNLDQLEATAKAEVEDLFQQLIGRTTEFSREGFSSQDVNFCCKMCSQILNRPVETQCQHIFCLSCLHTVFLQASTSTVPCPSCHTNINLKNISPVKAYFNCILEKSLKVMCNTCKRSSWLESTCNHDCQDPYSSQQIDEEIFKDILTRNVSPLGKLGQKMTSKLLRQEMKNTGATELRLSTGGEVS